MTNWRTLFWYKDNFFGWSGFDVDATYQNIKETATDDDMVELWNTVMPEENKMMTYESLCDYVDSKMNANELFKSIGVDTDSLGCPFSPEDFYWFDDDGNLHETDNMYDVINDYCLDDMIKQYCEDTGNLPEIVDKYAVGLSTWEDFWKNEDDADYHIGNLIAGY